MKWLKAFFLSRRFFSLLLCVALLFLLAYFFGLLLPFARAALLFLTALTVLDAAILYGRSGVTAERSHQEKLSNGDDNIISITVWNSYLFPIRAEIIDELPFQFQKRDLAMRERVPPGSRVAVSYLVRPVERGEYSFGAINVFTTSPLGLAVRRYRFSRDAAVPVYPSIIQMRKYDLFAVSNRLTEVGIKKIRRIGSSMEFDQIRKYVMGDDYRKINWKATARRNKIMVNQYRDERSQHVYSVIDMGRVMKMPFNAMTLLDYAINAGLVISNIAIRKEDRAGVITFSNKIEAFLPALREHSQMRKILELLYNCKTNFLESNYGLLYAELSRKLNQRSLILLFTNFETVSSLRRNIAYLSMIAKKHFLVIIFFINTELAYFLDRPADSVEMVYIKTIAEMFSHEKRQIIKELDRHGIHSLLTSPEHLTVNTINKYLELKSRGLI